MVARTIKVLDESGRVVRVKPMFERVMAKATKAKAKLYADEVAALVPNLRAKHDPLLHETQAAIEDTGELLFCPECRTKLLVRRLLALLDEWEEKGVVDEPEPEPELGPPVERPADAGRP